jgi:hypothetical protein
VQRSTPSSAHNRFYSTHRTRAKEKRKNIKQHKGEKNKELKIMNKLKGSFFFGAVVVAADAAAAASFNSHQVGLGLLNPSLCIHGRIVAITLSGMMWVSGQKLEYPVLIE